MKRLTRLFLLATLTLPAAVWACPMCKESIPDSDAAQATSLPGGFNFSIYYMLIGLFAMIGLCATVITKGVRSTNAQMQRGNDQTRIQNDDAGNQNDETRNPNE